MDNINDGALSHEEAKIFNKLDSHLNKLAKCSGLECRKLRVKPVE